MAQPFKKQTVRYYTPTGQRCEPSTPGAVKRVEESRKYYGLVPQPNGRRKAVPLCPDKAKSQQMLNKLLANAALESVGLTDPFAEHRKRHLAGHLDDWEADLKARGCTPEHARQTAGRARKVATACKFLWIGDLSASRVQQYVADLREGGRSVQTCNFYLQAIKQFARWLVKDRRAGDNPLAHLSGGNVRLDRRHDRRELSREELAALLEAARSGPAMRGLSGPDRAMLYAVAAYTGLRASELASLEPGSFALDAESPTVTVQAGYSKRRRTDTLPLHPDLARELRGWLSARHADTPVWPGRWAKGKEAGVMLKADLERARNAWVEKAEDDKERQRREASEFLAYRDGAGRCADFHALRHTFISTLARSGISPKVAQTLARHSTITLTMDRYTHTGLHDIATAVGSLPPLPLPSGPTSEADELRATGTDGVPGCTLVAQPADRNGHPEAPAGQKGAGNEQGVAATQPLALVSDGTCSHPGSAEREGFEPSVSLRIHRFSRPAQSTTLAPLRLRHLIARPPTRQGRTRPQGPPRRQAQINRSGGERRLIRTRKRLS